MSQPEPRRDPQERRCRVLTAAVEEFARSGYARASTNRMAQRARVAKGLIFHYFGSKQALYEAALDEAWRLIFAPARESLPADPFQRLEVVVAQRARRLQTHPDHARLLAQVLGQSPRILGGASLVRLQSALGQRRAAFRAGLDLRAFRPDISPAMATDLVDLVAEGLEITLLQDFGPSRGTTRLAPCALEERLRGISALLRKGIYQPGRPAVPRPRQAWNPEAFIALPAQLLPPTGAQDHRRDRILHAAQKLFASRGYDGVSAEAIAEEAGVAKGLIFHYFGSKAGLYLAAVGDAHTRISTAFFQDLPPPPPDLLHRIYVWSQRKIQIFGASPTLYRLVLAAFASPPEDVRPALEAYAVQGLAKGWSLLLEGVDTSPFRPEVPPARALELVMLVVDTLTNRLMIRLTSGPEQSLEELPRILQEVGQYLELLRDGLGPA